MEHHSLDLLEFEKIREELASYCIGDEGAAHIMRQSFYTSWEHLEPVSDRVWYLKRLLETDIRYPAIHLPSISTTLERAGKEGTVLDAEQIVSIGLFVNGSRSLIKYATKSIGEGETSPIGQDCEGAPDCDSLAQSIFSYFEEDGAIRENLPELKSIRRKIRSAQQDLSALATSYLQERASIWQTNVPTQKDGRLVLPLKTNHRGRIPGVVREVSSSGATVFLEPFDIVEKNNQLAFLDHEYHIEVAKILRKCTEMIRDHRHDIAYLQKIACEIDSLLAKARFARRHRCNRAECIKRGFRLIGARHPLLGSDVVPVDVELAGEDRILVITGPNAGGKTVTLKTVGLFALMNQFGMCIPADEGSGLQLYDQVFADIGDDQSRQESLSTFSGHMKNISQFIQSAGGRSLILLDELGSGTDPDHRIRSGVRLRHLSGGGDTVIRRSFPGVRLSGF